MKPNHNLYISLLAIPGWIATFRFLYPISLNHIEFHHFLIYGGFAVVAWLLFTAPIYALLKKHYDHREEVVLREVLGSALVVFGVNLAGMAMIGMHGVGFPIIGMALLFLAVMAGAIYLLYHGK